MSGRPDPMFTIRKEQWDALTAVRVRALCAWLLPHLREHFTELLEDTSDASLAPFIARSVERARALGAVRSHAVCRFVHLQLVFGPGFESLPWAASVLADPELEPDHKMAFLTILAGQLLPAQAEEAE